MKMGEGGFLKEKRVSDGVDGELSENLKESKRHTPWGKAPGRVSLYIRMQTRDNL